MPWKRHHVQHVKGFWKRPEDLEMGFGKDPCKVVLEKTDPKEGYGKDMWVLEKIQNGGREPSPLVHKMALEKAIMYIVLALQFFM